MVVVEHRQRAAVIEEAQRRGEILARDLAAVSHAPLLLYHFTLLEQNVARLALEEDVRYAIILDGEGRVAAHSARPELVGLVLPDEIDRRAAATLDPIVQKTRTETGEVLDDFAVAVLVSQQKWGVVRVGMSRQRTEALIRRTRGELGGLTAITLLLGGLGAALVAGGSPGRYSSSPRGRSPSRGVSSTSGSSPPLTMRSGAWPSRSTT